MAIFFKVINHLNFTCLSSWALMIFAILSDECFPKENFLLREGLQKILYSDNTLPSQCGLTSSSCGGLQPRLFCPLGKKRAFLLFVPILSHFWVSVVTSVTFVSNLSKFEKNPKFKKKKVQNNFKNPK